MTESKSTENKSTEHKSTERESFHRQATDLISTDQPLTEPERAALDALLDTLLPASEDGAMPSAAAVGFDAYLLTQHDGFLADLARLLRHFEPPFAARAMPARCEQVAAFSTEHPLQFRDLLSRVYDCYYQNDRVRAQIGVVTGAPYPQGNEIVSGDLSLLDPVLRNSTQHQFRKP